MDKETAETVKTTGTYKTIIRYILFISLSLIRSQYLQGKLIFHHCQISPQLVGKIYRLFLQYKLMPVNSIAV
jgi:hypothetical protein